VEVYRISSNSIWKSASFRSLAIIGPSYRNKELHYHNDVLKQRPGLTYRPGLKREATK
jgi:hypothetical protein